MKNWTLLFCLVVFLLSLGSVLREDEPKKKNPVNGLRKVTGEPSMTHLNINRLSTPIYNDGCSDNNWSRVGVSGLVYPKGSGKSAIFATGLTWGARHGKGGPVQVGGNTWWPNLLAGKLLPGLIPEDPSLPQNRIYRVRPDIPPGNTTADIRSEAKDGEGSASDIYNQYHKDWEEWPWQDGAPYNDINGNGIYEPAIDIPGVKGADQTVFYVSHDFNPDVTQYNWKCDPFGIEIHATFWAYNREGALGSTFFRKYVFINKSATLFDSMYVAIWSDPDLGYSGDDLVGCDSLRSLGFVYNGLETDRDYAPLPPPAVGYDFFQGPLVTGTPTDSAIYAGKRVYGKKNLPMSAFFPFAYPGTAPDEYTDPNFGRDGYVAVPQWYNLLRGLTKFGKSWVSPSGASSTFPFTGDPEKKTGWLDGQLFPANDRRMGLSSGPFTMAPGDTQEVVLAEIAAGAISGITRTKAVTLLKQYDDEAQSAYDNFFNLPNAPPAPRVTAIAMNRQVVLSWGDDIAAVAATENSNVRGYKFQGYNIYQLPNVSAAVQEGKRLATYDLVDGVQTIIGKTLDPAIGEFVNVGKQFGTDSGVKRFYRVTTDAFNSDFPLINGSPYYFAVTSYNYSPDSLADPNTFENTISVITAVPHSVDPGTRYASVFGDTIKGVVQTTASGGIASEGKVIPLVVDPTKTNGHSYKVTFDTAAGSTVWSLTDQTAGAVCLSKQKNQSGNDDYLTVNGIMLKVFGPAPGVKRWEIPSGTRRFSPVGGDYRLRLEGFSTTDDPAAYDQSSGTIGWAGNFVFGGIGTNLMTSRYHTVLLKLAAIDTGALWNPKNPPADVNYSRAYRWLRSVGTSSTPADPSFAPWIINKGSGYPYQDYNYAVPFSAWDMDATPPVRLSVGILENNVVGGLVDGRYWPPVANIGDNTVSREYCFIFAKPYSDTPDPSLQVNLSNSVTPMMWVMTCTRINGAPWAAGDQFRINAIRVNTPNNAFSFTAPQNTIDDPTLARDDIKQINVFPNPYYGANPLEQDKYYRFITFTHLPSRAIIRIFNLAGVLVKRINKETISQFERWDLKNEDGLPVGSGLYIAHIEMPDLGVNKILKIAVVQEQQILDKY